MNPDRRDPAGAATPTSHVARSAARLMAVQALYQMAVSGGDAEAVILEFVSHPRGIADDENKPLAQADMTLFADLVRGARARQANLDEMLAASIDPSWPIERIEILLRAILRCGAYELTAHPETPARVIISEYVHVADAFFANKEPGLVNAVLDRLARTLRPEQLARGDAEGDGDDDAETR